MKRLIAPLNLFLLVAAGPAHAVHADRKDEAARFDAAVVAGDAKVYSFSGLETISRVTTIGCVTYLSSSRDDWEIDWTTATIDDVNPGTKLDVTMGRPDAVFTLQFGESAKLRSARSAAKGLDAACK